MDKSSEFDAYTAKVTFNYILYIVNGLPFLSMFGRWCSLPVANLNIVIRLDGFNIIFT